MALTNDDAGSFAPPTTIGPFRVLHQVGAGVLGPVFRAHDGEGREVAVKLFRLDLTPEQAAEFASALESLARRLPTHPHIIACVGAGLAGSTAWMAEQYVGADALDARIRRRTGGGLKQILPVLSQMADALDAASSAGVHHGALHPRDVLLSTTGDVHVTGFGVADALRAVGGPPVVRRPYCAPERIANPRQSPEGAADVFSMGAIAVELLTGRRPLGVGAAAANLVSGVADGVDADRCRAALARALAESPTERFPTASAFVAALGRAVDDVLFHERETSPPRGARRERAVADHDDARPHHATPDLDTMPSRAGSDAVIVPADTSSAPQPAPTELPQPQAQTEVADARARDDLEPPAAPPDVGRLHEPVPPPPDDGPTPPYAESHLTANLQPAAEATELELRLVSEPVLGSVDREQAEQAIVIRSAAPPTEEGIPVGLPADIAGEAGSVRIEDPRALDDFESEAQGAATRLAAEERHPRRSPGVRRPARRPSVPQGPIAPEPHESDVPTLLGEPQVSAGMPLGTRSRTVGLALGLFLGVGVGVLIGYLVWGGPGPQRGRPPVLATEQSVGPEGGKGERTDAARSSASTGTPRPEASSGVVAARPERAAAPAATSMEAPPLAREGRLVIRSSPSGARVTVNGRARGTTPLTLDDVRFGSYEVGVARQGFRREVRRVAVSQETPAATLSVTLHAVAQEPAARNQTPAARSSAGAGKGPGSIEVLSRPAGAKVYLDSQLIGTTPYHGANIAPGRRSVRIVLDGYGPWQTTVEIPAGGASRVAASLELVPSH